MSMLAGRATTLRPQVRAGTGLLVLIVLLGSLLRFAGLGNESIWLDEATSILIARMDLPSVVVWTAADIHPPLYYLILHFWLGFGESEFAIRALSAMLGVVAVVIVYALARELFDEQVGLLSALLLALSPMHIWYSQEARMYAMVTTWSLTASYFLVLALRRSAQRGVGSLTLRTPQKARDGVPNVQTRYWLGYLLFSVLALYTHYYALFVLLFQNVFVLCWLWLHKAGKTCWPDLWRRWLLVELAIAVSFLPWVPVVYRQVSSGGGGWVEKSIGRPTVRDLLDTWLHFSTGLDRQVYPQDLRRMAYALFAVCILAAAATLLGSPGTRLPRQPRGMEYRASLRRWVRQTDSYRIGLWFCVLYVAVPLLAAWLVSQIKPMYSERYLLPFVPPYCILVAYGLRALRWRWLRLAVVLCLTLTLLVGDWNAWRIEQREDWRWASSYVLDRAEPGDVVLFLPRWLAKPFDYYARGRVALSMDLPVPVTPQAVQEVTADMAQRYERVWFVWQRGHYGDPDGLVKQVFDSRFRLVQEVEFPAVGSLVLYSLESTPKALD
jgi:mannosyltransferase